jgi:hypothetical protein
MKIIEGIANIYKEVSGEHQFDYSVFVYPNPYAAASAIEKQNLKEKLMQVGGRSVKVRIEIPEITEEVDSHANGSGLTEKES